MRLKLELLTLLAALPLAAQPAYTITPDSGPTSGGTHVTIKGNFGAWPYGVIFGGIHVPATRVGHLRIRHRRQRGSHVQLHRTGAG